MLDRVLDYQRVQQATEDQLEAEPALQLLQFSVMDIEGFRYRVEDVSRAVTRVAVREARLKELKAEMLNSEKLKAHFEDNPRELELIKHDKVLRGGKVQRHLASVPRYLQPRTGAIVNAPPTKRRKRKSAGKKAFLEKKRKNAEAADPLQTFSVGKQLQNQPKVKPVLPKSGAGGTFSEHRVGFDQSTAGRRKWKNGHSAGGKKQDKTRKNKWSGKSKPLYQA